MNGKERIQAACRCEPVDRPPVWMMRQAGRTLPEYRALKEKYSFWELCRTPELAAEVTMQPLRRFPVDAAIIFSDILVVPAAMGLDIEFTPAPRLSRTIRTRADVDGLKAPDPHRSLGYVRDALTTVADELHGERALLGFAGAPWTLACYMVDGVGSKGFVQTRALMYEDPDLLQALLTRLADAVADYVEMQVDAGITAFQLFDTWAGDLGPAEFERFAMPAVARIFERLSRKDTPGIYYVNGIGNVLEVADQAGSAALGIDWRIPLGEVRRRVGSQRVVQGNLDPAALFGTPEFIRERVFAMLDATGGRGHIVNLGHGLMPSIPVAGIEAFVGAVAEWAEKTNDRP